MGPVSIVSASTFFASMGSVSTVSASTAASGNVSSSSFTKVESKVRSLPSSKNKSNLYASPLGLLFFTSPFPKISCEILVPGGYSP